MNLHLEPGMGDLQLFGASGACKGFRASFAAPIIFL